MDPESLIASETAEPQVAVSDARNRPRLWISLGWGKIIRTRPSGATPQMNLSSRDGNLLEAIPAASSMRLLFTTPLRHINLIHAPIFDFHCRATASLRLTALPLFLVLSRLCRVGRYAAYEIDPNSMRKESTT